MKKNSKFKEYIKYFKELWSVPRYKAIIKLLLYFLMFMLLFLMAKIYYSNNTNSELDENNSYTDIINNSDFNNLKIDYIINVNDQVYTIDGEINNGIFEGYVENNQLINKIAVKDNNIYKISSSIETYDIELNSIIKGFFLVPNNIIELVKNEQSYIEKTDNSSSYTYNIYYNNIQYEIIIKTNLIQITNIELKNNLENYNLNINFDK